MLFRSLAKLSSTAFDLRRRAVATFKSASIQSITIAGKSAKVADAEVVLTREPGPHGGSQWKYAAKDGKTFAVDDEKMTRLLGDLDPLTAQKWLRNLSNIDLKAAPGDLTLTLLAQPSAPTGTQPATQAIAGPVLSQTVRIVLHRLPDGTYQARTDAEAAAPLWDFQPTADLVEHLTNVDYRPAAATQPTSAPATAPTTGTATQP